MELQPISDPLGTGTQVTLSLPRPKPRHFAPLDQMTALHRAGLNRASAVFIDDPTADHAQWPSEDAAFLEAIIGIEPESILTPLVWARVRTAPRYPSLREVEAERFPFPSRGEVPREPGWPADFSGTPAETLNRYVVDVPGARLVQHVPPGDGWHRVAWIGQEFGDSRMQFLLCECGLQYVIDSRGQRTRFGDDEQCVYRTVAAYLRALSCQRDYPESTPAALRKMVDAALDGQWLGQRSGDQLWGSNLYLQAVSVVLDVPMPWELAASAVEAGLISLDGAVVGLPQPVRAAPAGPVMDWDSNQESDGNWVVWWVRLDGRYQVEVTRHPDSTSHGTMAIYDHANNDIEIHTEQVSLAYGAVFGPDTGDVDAWMARAMRAADEHRG